MSLRTSATRYARALFDVALRESDPARIEQELDEIVGAIEGQPELRRALLHGAVPQTIRLNVVKALVEATSPQPPLAKLLLILAEKGRLELLPHLRDVYRERLLAHGNVVRAFVTSATALGDDKVRALEHSLSQLTGKRVQLEVAVDRDLIGGVVARIGSTVYDGSLRTQLQKLKQQLVTD
jgi:F-type H+-transporting ATPase subunit delta